MKTSYILFSREQGKTLTTLAQREEIGFKEKTHRA